MTSVDRINQLDKDAFISAVFSCCGCQKWAQLMECHRPYSSEEQMQQQAKTIWQTSLNTSDYLEAFASHPRIGQKRIEHKDQQFEKWSKSEQAGIENTAQTVLQELAQYNEMYFNKFGFIYIVFASGKTQEQMLAILKERLGHTMEEEIAIAAGEQEKITALRIAKLLNDS